MDTYVLAFSAVMLASKTLADGITLSLISTYQQVDRRDGRKGRNELTSNSINSFSLISLVLIIIGLLLAPIIIRIMGPGFKGQSLEKTIKLFRLGLPIMLLDFIRAICAGYLQSQHKFKAGAKSGVVNSLVYIFYLIIFGDKFGLEGVILAGILAVLGQIVVMMAALVSDGYKYETYQNLQDRTLKRVISFLFPISLGIGINELNIAIDNAVASSLAQGTIAELSYANGIINFIYGIFIVAIITAIFPVLSKNYDQEDLYEFRQNIRFVIKLLIGIIIPISLLLIKYSNQLVKFVYGRGEFGAREIEYTSEFLKFYAMGLIGLALVLLIVRIYYAIHDTKTPTLIAGLVLLTNLIFNIILGRTMGGSGIALASTISVVLASIVGLYDLKRKIF